ncbi:hypothetical protein W911_09400 [Hyphomicrobium nitrativorans NL23]|uniref:Uncharacterized protein n=1 Tax=Hyphomicrobium nitrativorans NL23 TaxID=1029756 RepID=V5SJ86_9HYPH|nr:hypothetical protein [Hyphomicrobium nitrativorans]AHB50155.1 hypothetical protein W911_09400 [Hyphomicrobium nitrativorans NL23]
MFSRQYKAAFDDDDLKALQRVFDAACAALMLEREDCVLRERLGAFVFEMAQLGERNERVLWSRAMGRFGDLSAAHSGPARRAGPPIERIAKKPRRSLRL